jgi:hypothetical protein
LKVLLKFEKPFVELAPQTYRMPSVEIRFDEIGSISEEQARKIGAVGMVIKIVVYVQAEGSKFLVIRKPGNKGKRGSYYNRIAIQRETTTAIHVYFGINIIFSLFAA